MKNKTWLALGLVAATLAAPGCGGDGGNGPPVETGTWSAPEPIGALSPAARGPSPSMKVIEGEDGSATALWLQLDDYNSDTDLATLSSLWWSHAAPGQAVPAQGWSPQALLARPITTFDASAGPQNSVSAVWSHLINRRDLTTDILLSRWTPASGWGAVQTVSPQDRAEYGGITGVSVAVAADGASLATWLYKQSGVPVYAAFQAPGSSWGKKRRINDFPSAELSFADEFDSQFAYTSPIAPLPDGRFLTAWPQIEFDPNSASHYAATIRSSLFNPASGWTPPAIAQLPDEHQFRSYLRIATSGHGAAALVWLRRYYFNSQLQAKADVYASYSTDGLSWSPEMLLGTTQANAQAPAVAFDAQDRAIVAWTDNQGTGSVRSAMGTTSGWVSKGVIASFTSVDDRADCAPDLAADGRGRILVAFRMHDGTSFRIAVSRFENEAWSPPRFISSNGAGSRADQPRIGRNAAGQATVAWQQHQDAQITLWAARYQP